MTTTPELSREIATTGDGRDITRGLTADVLQPLDSVLRRRAGDLTLYEAVLDDWQVAATFQQRRLACTAAEYRVEPGGNKRQDKAAAAFLTDILEHIGWDRVTEKMLFGIFYGYAVSELIYARDGRHITIDEVRVRNRRRFRFTPDSELRLITFDDPLLGEPAEVPYFWHYATGADHDDEPYGLGLAHWCYWPVLFKRHDLKFWLVFLDKFGMPTAVGTYEGDPSRQERQRLLDATRAVQSDSGIIMPKGMAIELLEAARTGKASYKEMHDAMDNAIAKSVLGQTMTTEASGGQYKAEVQMEVRRELVRADAALNDESFNRGPVRWLMEWNYPNAAPPRVYRDLEEPEDLDSRSERDNKIRTWGFQPTLAYVTETYGGEWVERDAAAPTDPPEFAEGDVPEDAADVLADMAEVAFGGFTDEMIDQVRELAEESRTLEEFAEAIEALPTEINLRPLMRRWQEGLAAAELVGASDGDDEAVR